MARPSFLGIAVGVAMIAVPVQADDDLSSATAMRRLRACVAAGASGAPRGALGAAVSAVRALCRPQIDRARSAEDRRITAENPRAGSARLAELQDQARRKLDYDLAVLVHHMTGAQP